jgi:hypothetical protein
MTKGNRLGSLLWGFFLGAAIAAAGGVFCYLLTVAFQRAMETRGWTETPCEIYASSVREFRPTPHSPMNYEAQIQYSYFFDGKQFEGSRVRRGDGASGNRSKAEKVVGAFPVGETTCWVDPTTPENAVLRHTSKGALYSIWFPGLFVIGGIGIMVAAVRNAFRRA